MIATSSSVPGLFQGWEWVSQESVSMPLALLDGQTKAAQEGLPFPSL